MRRPDFATTLLAGGSVLYPGLVYAGLPHLRPGLLAALAIGLGGLHLLRRRGLDAFLPRWSLLAILAALLALLVLRPLLAAQAYPPLVSLSLAAAFAWSLWRPPSAIERIARLTTPDLPSAAVAYTRTVTKVWTGFFFANAAIAVICAAWLPVGIWALWTGLVSYMLIGALFAGEFLVRRWRLQRAAT